MFDVQRTSCFVIEFVYDGFRSNRSRLKRDLTVLNSACRWDEKTREKHPSELDRAHDQTSEFQVT